MILQALRKRTKRVTMMDIADEWRVFMEARQAAPPVQVESIPRKLGIEFRKAFFTNGISGMLERLESGFRITVNGALKGWHDPRNGPSVPEKSGHDSTQAVTCPETS